MFIGLLFVWVYCVLLACGDALVIGSLWFIYGRFDLFYGCLLIVLVRLILCCVVLFLCSCYGRFCCYFRWCCCIACVLFVLCGDSVGLLVVLVVMGLVLVLGCLAVDSVSLRDLYFDYSDYACGCLLRWICCYFTIDDSSVVIGFSLVLMLFGCLVILALGRFSVVLLVISWLLVVVLVVFLLCLVCYLFACLNYAIYCWIVILVGLVLCVGFDCWFCCYLRLVVCYD